jgi:hypothetical protein
VLEGMSEEEKEREAERLFVLFERMEKNPVIKARGDDGVERGVGEVMRGKMLDSQGQDGGGRERQLEEKEEREREEREEKDEREAMRDLEAYRRRKAGK